jgi:hypothetical protein
MELCVGLFFGFLLGTSFGFLYRKYELKKESELRKQWEVTAIEAVTKFTGGG